MAEFYSYIDIAYVKHAPQPVQLLVNRAMAERLGGSIVFYFGEDVETVQNFAILQAKLRERPAVKGFIFFRLSQLLYGERINLEIVRTLIKSGYEVHFARENLSIRSIDDLKGKFSMLYTFDHIARRDQSSAYLDPVRRWLGYADIGAVDGR